MDGTSEWVSKIFDIIYCTVIKTVQTLGGTIGWEQDLSLILYCHQDCSKIGQQHLLTAGFDTYGMLMPDYPFQVNFMWQKTGVH